MMATEQKTNLIVGSDLMSRYSAYCFSPMSLLFEFDPTTHKPKPLPIISILIMSIWVPILLIMDVISQQFTAYQNTDIMEVRLVRQSPTVLNVFQAFNYFRFTTHLVTLLIVLAQHGPVANVIASSEVFVNEDDQIRLARKTFFVFFVRSLARCLSYMTVFLYIFEQVGIIDLHWPLVLAIIYLIGVISLNVSKSTPLMHATFIGAALGKHVKNFSEIYVDSLFDQFMKAIEMENQSYDEDDEAQVPEFITNAATSDHSTSHRILKLFWTGLVKFFKFIGWLFIATRRLIRAVFNRLNMRHYPELPEMKMAKLSTTKNIQISERMRSANNDLIRLRLRRTQIMLSDLRDKVNDINRLSSPLFLVYVLFDTVSIILITTSSIQARVYRSLNMLLLPTVVTTIGIVLNVTYICSCMDDTSKELKLMINKLFDFIIMNHRVKSSDKKSNTEQFLAQQQLDWNGNPIDRKHSVSSDLTSGNNLSIMADEASEISETWSQFQYTRKLANTIQFTMGGILPITRRLVLSILGHILSATFISIEIMSIYDTSQNISHSQRNITLHPLHEAGEVSTG